MKSRGCCSRSATGSGPISPDEDALRRSVSLLIGRSGDRLPARRRRRTTSTAARRLPAALSPLGLDVRRDCWLEDLYVEEPARGRGLGRALVEAACERARTRGARRIELDTNESNQAAIALYESCGFSAASKEHGAANGRDLFFGRRL